MEAERLLPPREQSKKAKGDPRARFRIVNREASKQTPAPHESEPSNAPDSFTKNMRGPNRDTTSYNPQETNTPQPYTERPLDSGPVPVGFGTDSFSDIRPAELEQQGASREDNEKQNRKRNKVFELTPQQKIDPERKKFLFELPDDEKYNILSLLPIHEKIFTLTTLDTQNPKTFDAYQHVIHPDDINKLSVAELRDVFSHISDVNNAEHNRLSANRDNQEITKRQLNKKNHFIYQQRLKHTTMIRQNIGDILASIMPPSDSPEHQQILAPSGALTRIKEMETTVASEYAHLHAFEREQILAHKLIITQLKLFGNQNWGAWISDGRKRLAREIPDVQNEDRRRLERIFGYARLLVGYGNNQDGNLDELIRVTHSPSTPKVFEDIRGEYLDITSEASQDSFLYTTYRHKLELFLEKEKADAKQKLVRVQRALKQTRQSSIQSTSEKSSEEIDKNIREKERLELVLRNIEKTQRTISNIKVFSSIESLSSKNPMQQAQAIDGSRSRPGSARRNVAETASAPSHDTVDKNPLTVLPSEMKYPDTIADIDQRGIGATQTPENSAVAYTVLSKTKTRASGESDATATIDRFIDETLRSAEAQPNTENEFSPGELAWFDQHKTSDTDPNLLGTSLEEIKNKQRGATPPKVRVYSDEKYLAEDLRRRTRKTPETRVRADIRRDHMKDSEKKLPTNDTIILKQPAVPDNRPHQAEQPHERHSATKIRERDIETQRVRVRDVTWDKLKNNSRDYITKLLRIKEALQDAKMRQSEDAEKIDAYLRHEVAGAFSRYHHLERIQREAERYSSGIGGFVRGLFNAAQRKNAIEEAQRTLIEWKNLKNVYPILREQFTFDSEQIQAQFRDKQRNAT